MLFNFYFHGDFDGRAAAAIALWFLKKNGDRVRKYTPVDYELIKEWVRPHFFSKRSAGAKVAIFDFPFHPQATIWYDHHETPFRNPAWAKVFKPSPFKQWNPEYKSCASQTLDRLSEAFQVKPPRHLKDLAYWGDMIDGAMYRSAKQAHFGQAAALKVMDFMDAPENKGKSLGWLIKLMSEQPLEKVARHPRVYSRTVELNQEKKTSLSFYRAHTKLLGQVAYVDETKARTVRLRFVPVMIYPRAKYVVRRRLSGGWYHFSVGVNPWNIPSKHPNLGDLMKRYGGGGHKKIGATDFPEDQGRADRITKEIISFLNKPR